MKNKSLELKHQNNRSLGLTFFLLGGFLASLVSLIVLIFLDIFLVKFLWLEIPFWSILIMVIIEELAKLKVLFFLIDLNKIDSIFFKSLSFGMGFAFFELTLIFLDFRLNSQNFLNLSALFLIHFITTFLLIYAIKNYKNFKIFTIFYLLLAIFIHLVYNLIAI